MLPRYNRFRARTESPSTTELPMNDVSLISVVDDDESLRESLEGLLKSLGYGVRFFHRPRAFWVRKLWRKPTA